MPPKAEIIDSARKSHLDSVSTASLPSHPEIQYSNEVKDVCHAQLCSWDTALAHLLLTCATPGMLGHSTLKLTSGWTGGVLAPAEKKVQSWFSHLNFPVQEREPKNATYPEQQPGCWCCQAIPGSLDHRLPLSGPRGYTRDQPPLIQVLLTNHWSSQIASFAWVTTC